MARIPEYSRKNIVPTAESPTQQVNPQMASTGARSLQTIGETVSDIGNMFMKARAVAEETKAINIYDSKKLQIVDEAAKDKDFSEVSRQKYHDRIQESMLEASQHISIPAERRLFLDQVSKKSVMAKIDVDNIFFKKSMDDAKANFSLFEQTQKELYINSTNPKVREQAILDADLLSQKMVDAGFLTREKAVEEKIKRDKEWTEDFIDNQIQQNPKFSFMELQKGEEGFYKGIPSDLRTEKIEKARIAVKRQDVERKQYLEIAKNQREAALMDKFFSGQLKESTVKDAMNRKDEFGNSEINPRFAMSMIRAINSPDTIKGKKDATLYMDLVDELKSGEFDPLALKEKILSYVGKGISSSQAEDLYVSQKIRLYDGKKTSLSDLVSAQKNLLKQSEESLKIYQTRNRSMQSALDMIISTVAPGIRNEAVDVLVSGVIENFFNRLSKEDPASDKIPQVAKEEIDKYTTQNNPNKTKYVLNQIVSNSATGKSYKVTGFDTDGEPIVDEIK